MRQSRRYGQVRLAVAMMLLLSAPAARVWAANGAAPAAPPANNAAAARPEAHAARAATAPPKRAAAAEACDYACLTGMLDRYVQALAAHNPAAVPLAPRVRLTENTVRLRPGQALWGTFSGLGTYRLAFADPQSGDAALEASIRENGTPAILLLRLRVAGGKITEVETVVHRNAGDALLLEKLGQPNPVWTTPLTPAQKTPRAEMARLANLYFDGILHSNGDMVPFDPRCNRILDGYQDTNNPTAKGWFDLGSFRPDAMGIRENMNTGVWSYIHSIEPRRIVVVDERMGIVLGMFMFNHPGNLLYKQVKGVGRVPMPPVVTHPSSVQMAEFFKIEGGKIRQIEGVSLSLPFGSFTGWESPAK